MQDGNFRVDVLSGVSGGGITQFAADVLARLVARDGEVARVLREPLVLALMAAVRTSNLNVLGSLKPDLKRARVSPEVFAECYIPEVARRLGLEWEYDTASFAEVTMGVARLQAILREMGGCWAADGYADALSGTMLLILPAQEQHTLGAMVVAGWLRRRGISVCLRIAPTEAELGALLAGHRFDGAMISVAANERLEVCAKLVKTLKNKTNGGLQVAVGGAVLERYEDVATVTGADIVTNDLSAVVQAFGLTVKRTLMAVTT